MKSKLLLVFAVVAFVSSLSAGEWSGWKTSEADRSVMYRVKSNEYNSDLRAYRWYIEFKNNQSSQTAKVKMTFYRRNKASDEWEPSAGSRELAYLKPGETHRFWCFYPSESTVRFEHEVTFE